MKQKHVLAKIQWTPVDIPRLVDFQELEYQWCAIKFDEYPETFFYTMIFFLENEKLPDSEGFHHVYLGFISWDEINKIGVASKGKKFFISFDMRSHVAIGEIIEVEQ
jgi:hypothetical protein